MKKYILFISLSFSFLLKSNEPTTIECYSSENCSGSVNVGDEFEIKFKEISTIPFFIMNYLENSNINNKEDIYEYQLVDVDDEFFESKDKSLNGTILPEASMSFVRYRVFKFKVKNGKMGIGQIKFKKIYKSKIKDNNKNNKDKDEIEDGNNKNKNKEEYFVVKIYIINTPSSKILSKSFMQSV